MNRPASFRSATPRTRHDWSAELGPSDWMEVDQGGVDSFGRSVQDWHWVHNDPERAVRGPLGCLLPMRT